MVTDIVLEDRFHQLMKEAGLKYIEAGSGINVDFLRAAYTVVQMLREGYPLVEIVKALKKAFIKRTNDTDPKVANLYINKVLGLVNDSVKGADKEDFSKAYEELERHLAVDNLRLKNYSSETPLTIEQKGNILARMIVVDGFSPEAVENAAVQNKALGFDNADDLKMVMVSCKEIAERYRAINAAVLKTPVNDYADIYRQYAKEYMQETNTLFLSPKDDEKILANLYMEIRYAVSQKVPQTEKGRKQLEDYMKLEILPGCSKAVEQASPVAAEGWRNKSRYLPCVIHGTEHISELMKNTDEKFDKTKSLVNAFFAQFDNSQDEAMRIYPETSLDTQLAKELLFERQDESLIKRAVEEYTRINGRDNFIVTNFKSKKDYAGAIMEGARESYNREQNLLFREKPIIPQGSYAQLREKNIPLSDLYVDAVKERLDLYPTFRLHLSDPSVDEELVGSIITKYPDVDLDELKEVISVHSPRAAMLGIPHDYANDVVDRAKAELSKVDKREHQLQDQKIIFNKSRGFTSEAYSNDPVEDYQNCKVAIDMLQENIPEVDVKQMIKDIAPQDENLSNPDMYASMIVSSAKRFLERSSNIENYRRDVTLPADIKDLYMEKAKQIMDKKGFADSNMDVEVYKELKLAGCDEVDIQTAIRSYSPSAMEAGRDEKSYCEFIKHSADFKLREEQDKLENYLVIPRLDEECTPDAEYEFQRKKMVDYISLPFNPEFDTKLARGLLEKNLEEEKVADVIDRLSPVAAGGEAFVGYGRSRVDEALKNMRRKVLVNEEVKEETKVTQHDYGMTLTRELTRTQTWAEQDEDES